MDPHTRTFNLADPVVSVVVPTRNEAGNIAELVRRLDAVAKTTPIEIIFVDDSTDDTPEVIERTRASGHPNINLIHRPVDQRSDGLGGAVVRGLQAAQATWACVMDADLQHPPELIPRLLEKATSTSSDLVVASRYRDDGEASSFAFTRKLASRGSTRAVKAVFPQRLRNISDPMSGFFLIRREAVDLSVLQPKGFKILLEIVGRTKGLRTAEVPFQFGSRFAGESKASLREGLRLTNTMLHLRFGGAAARFTQFGLVGLTGLLVNSLALAAAYELLSLPVLVAAIMATQVSTGWNLAITERFVFAGTGRRFNRMQRGLMFYAMNNAAFALRAPLLYTLVAIEVNYLVSNIVSLVILLVLRFFTADRWIWGTLQGDAAYSPAIITTSPSVNEGASR